MCMSLPSHVWTERAFGVCFRRLNWPCRSSFPRPCRQGSWPALSTQLPCAPWHLDLWHCGCRQVPLPSSRHRWSTRRSSGPPQGRWGPHTHPLFSLLTDDEPEADWCQRGELVLLNKQKRYLDLVGTKRWRDNSWGTTGHNAADARGSVSLRQLWRFKVMRSNTFSCRLTCQRWVTPGSHNGKYLLFIRK